MDSTSPIAQGIAGQPSFASGSFFKPTFAMEFLTLVENLFVGRRWPFGFDGDGCDPCRDRNGGRTRTLAPDHRRYRERHSRLAEGHGRAS